VRVLFHPDTAAAEDDAFGFKTKALFESVFTRQRDFATGADYAMPGQAARGTQRPDDLTCATGEAGRAGDFAIGGNFSFGNSADRVADDFEHALLTAVPGQGPAQTLFERELRAMAEIADGGGGVGL